MIIYNLNLNHVDRVIQILSHFCISQLKNPNCFRNICKLLLLTTGAWEEVKK